MTEGIPAAVLPGVRQDAAREAGAAQRRSTICHIVDPQGFVIIKKKKVQ